MCVRARRLSGARGSDRPQGQCTPLPCDWITSQRLAWFTEPRLAVGERRMVDQSSAGWNQLAMWLRDIGQLRDVA
jgi:hypothetical protein